MSQAQVDPWRPYWYPLAPSDDVAPKPELGPIAEMQKMDFFRGTRRKSGTDLTQGKQEPHPPSSPAIPPRHPQRTLQAQTQPQNTPQEQVSTQAQASKAQASTQPSQPHRLPHTDSLPTDPTAQESLLNHNLSQLQKLADRVEYVNEWIEMDGIRLDKMMKDLRQEIDTKENQKEEEEARKKTMQRGTILPTTTTTTTPILMTTQKRETAQGYRGVGHGGRGILTPNPKGLPKAVRFHEPSTAPERLEASIEAQVKAHCDINELRQRIKAMKKWRVELANHVLWRREEHERILRAMGKMIPVEEAADVEGEMMGNKRVGWNWGVGGRVWEKRSGRVPTSLEWDLMLSPERLGWDENGSRAG